MHAAVLFSGLATLLSASLVVAQGCGRNVLPIGSPCGTGMFNGHRVCDPSCRDILVCHNGIMQLNNHCAPGQCIFKDDAHTAFCVGNKHAAHTLAQVDEPNTAVEQDSVPKQCGLPSEEGKRCSPLIKEGGQLCDKECKSILECRNDTMELLEDCTTDDEEKECLSTHGTLGKAVYCGKFGT